MRGGKWGIKTKKPQTQQFGNRRVKSNCSYISTCALFHFGKPRENRTEVTTAASINGKDSIALDHIPSERDRRWQAAKFGPVDSSDLVPSGTGLLHYFASDQTHS